MDKFVKTNIPGFYKNIETGTVINKNVSELNQYMIERNRAVEQLEINKKVDELTNAVSEIKEILKMVVEKRNGS